MLQTILFVLTAHSLAYSQVAGNKCGSGCCPSLTHLNEAGLAKNDRDADKTVMAGKTVSIGEVKFDPEENGFVVTCQCKGAGDSCYLEFFDKDLALNATETWNFVDESVHKLHGKFALITSSLVTCNADGTNVINNMTVTHFACSAYDHKYCPHEMDEETDLEYLASRTETMLVSVGETEALPLNDGFQINCQCQKNSGQKCSLYIIDTNGTAHVVKGNVTKLSDGSFPLISSERLICDESGLTEFTENGETYTADRYACVAENFAGNSAPVKQFFLINLLLLLVVSIFA